MVITACVFPCVRPAGCYFQNRGRKITNELTEENGHGWHDEHVRMHVGLVLLMLEMD